VSTPNGENQPTPLARTKTEVLEHLLRTGEIVRTIQPPNGTLMGAFERFMAFVELDSGLIAVVKMGANPGALDAVRREVAAYELCKVLGLALVPPTVLRLHKSGDRIVEISVQLYVQGLDYAPADFTNVADEELCDAAAFELAACQIDRQDRNWGILHGGDGDHLVFFDNTWTFDLEPPDMTLPELAGWTPGTPLSSIYDWAQAQLGGPNFKLLERLLRTDALKVLEPYLTPEEIAAIARRARGENAA
jgi:hypothetical protein